MDAAAVSAYADSGECRDRAMCQKLKLLLCVSTGDESSRLSAMAFQPAGMVCLQAAARAWCHALHTRQEEAALSAASSSSSAAVAQEGAVACGGVAHALILATLSALADLSSELELDIGFQTQVCTLSGTATVWAFEIKRGASLAEAVDQLQMRTAVAAFTVQHLHPGLLHIQRVGQAWVPVHITAVAKAEFDRTVKQAAARAKAEGMVLEVRRYDFP